MSTNQRDAVPPRQKDTRSRNNDEKSDNVTFFFSIVCGEVVDCWFHYERVFSDSSQWVGWGVVIGWDGCIQQASHMRGTSGIEPTWCFLSFFFRGWLSCSCEMEGGRGGGCDVRIVKYLVHQHHHHHQHHQHHHYHHQHPTTGYHLSSQTLPGTERCVHDGARVVIGGLGKKKSREKMTGMLVT